VKDPALNTLSTEKTAVRALAALAQETRLAIYRLLVQQGPLGMSVGTIAARLELPNATLSFHLKELANAELIVALQEGRFIYYSANYPAMNGLIDFLTENCCNGNVCDAACAPLIKRKRKAS
jgi:DNA-binding transcriptional ArsR family regulator